RPAERRVVLEEAEADEGGRRAVVHDVTGIVLRTELDAAPVAEGEQVGFVDRTHGASGTSRRVPAFELDARADRSAVIQLRLADEMNFTFLDELEALVLNRRAVRRVAAFDRSGERVELVVATNAHLDGVGCHGGGGHQTANCQGGRA